jgi:hypothetical protein
MRTGQINHFSINIIAVGGPNPSQKWRNYWVNFSKEVISRTDMPVRLLSIDHGFVQEIVNHHKHNAMRSACASQK